MYVFRKENSPKYLRPISSEYLWYLLNKSYKMKPDTQYLESPLRFELKVVGQQWKRKYMYQTINII